MITWNNNPPKIELIETYSKIKPIISKQNHSNFSGMVLGLNNLDHDHLYCGTFIFAKCLAGSVFKPGPAIRPPRQIARKPRGD